jgi:hypothetical protein
LTIVLTRSLPGIEEVDIALGQSRDFDQPVWPAGADKGAKLVDVARRNAWIDAEIATSASEGVSVDNVGECISTRREGYGYREGERQKEIEQDAEEHIGWVMTFCWE